MVKNCSYHQDEIAAFENELFDYKIHIWAYKEFVIEIFVYSAKRVSIVQKMKLLVCLNLFSSVCYKRTHTVIGKKFERGCLCLSSGKHPGEAS